jgi:hypothetical protein
VSVHEEIILEMARLERRAVARTLERARAQQLGEAWRDLPILSSTSSDSATTVSTRP